MTTSGAFRFERSIELPASAEEAYAWHARAGALARMIPPWEPVRILSQRGGFTDGAETELRLRVGPWPMRWVARHVDHVIGRQFVDEQIAGPFARWSHTHRFAPLAADRCRLTDIIDWVPPLGPAGAVAHGAITRRLERVFRYRQRVLAADLAAHALCPGPRLSIALTGASGMLGRALSAYLTTAGHRVLPLVRRAPGPDEIGWDPAAGRIDGGRLEGLDAVVHLAGETVAQRWTSARMRRIWDSRERGTALLTRTLASLSRPPRALISASAVGAYGDRGGEVLTEASALPAANSGGFLAGVGRAWESATDAAAKAGIRVVRLRIGIVLTPSGGALPPMLIPFQFGLGGRMGSGDQWMSWIALDDLLGAFEHVLMTPALSGPVNAVAPTPVTNAEFTTALAEVLHRPALLPVPAAALRLLLGQMADEMLLGSQRVIPDQLRASGYSYRYPQLEGALRHVLGR
jgi:uncharacterized protein (TIGR01777 family)